MQNKITFEAKEVKSQEMKLHLSRCLNNGMCWRSIYVSRAILKSELYVHVLLLLLQRLLKKISRVNTIL